MVIAANDETMRKTLKTQQGFWLFGKRQRHTKTSEVDTVENIIEYSTKLENIDAAKILRIHRYRDIEAVRKDVREAAERHALEALELLDVRFFYQRQKVIDLTADKLLIGEGTAFHCRAFEGILQESEEVVLFLLSTGKALDNRVQRYLANFEVLEALFLETAGWLAIEAVTRIFALHLRKEISPEGFGLTARMGPGYSYKVAGDKTSWDLLEQRQLFEQFKGCSLPIELLDSCAIWPKLSRSGLYGLVRKSQHK